MIALIIAAILNHSQLGREILAGLMLVGLVLVGIYFGWAA